ncbi:DNA-methyltransferase [Candidatus Avelusimicrobium faecicola]|uniref:DNA-methyltransferase n=1 Tax=Candidatus Avelusimicrobium faecicola TaxID=3416205 RepID=UPI003D14213B
MPSVKSSRNRTLTVSPQEKEFLRSKILYPSNLSKISWKDSIICADLLKTLDLLPNHFADLIIVDPPYNLTKNFHGVHFQNRSNADYARFVQTWLPKVCTKLKPSGSLYMCGDWGSTAVLQTELEKELTVLNRITWQREKGRGALTNWKNSMEDIWFAVKDPNHYYFDVDSVKIKRKVIAPYREDGQPKDWQAESQGNFRLTCPSNFWDDITVPFWSMPENTPHPTQKPEKLYAKLILASSRPGEVVFDPFLGSGTSSVVAKKLGRHFCGVEINEEYCFYAAKRLEQAQEDCSIQGYQNGVFWERNTLNCQKKEKSAPKKQKELF